MQPKQSAESVILKTANLPGVSLEEAQTCFLPVNGL